MRVQHNIMALNANRNLGMNNSNVSKSLEKLSSGYRINRAADDAAGLAISEKMRAQISCLSQAETNCQDGISLIQTAEGALTEVHDMLNRMVELAEQSANGTYDNDVDRKNLQAEVDQLQKEIDRIANATNFNGIKLLDGTLGASTGEPEVYFDTKNLAAASAVVTKAAGANLAVGQEANVEVGNNTNEIKVTIGAAGLTGQAKTDVLDLNKVIVREDGTKLGECTGGLLKAGERAIIDLTSVGLGRVEIVSTSDTACTAENLATALAGAISGVSDAVSNGAGAGLTLQIGENAESSNLLTVNVQSMTVASLGVDDVNIASQSSAAIAIEKIKEAINTVSAQRGTLGAMQNRLEHTINNLSVTNENITNAESRIRDTDMAKEMMTYTSKNILSQAAQSMLAQANQVPQQVLSLLQ